MLRTIVDTLIPKTALQIFNEGKIEGSLEQVRMRENQKQISDLFELEQFVGKRIICIGNEWEDPFFGTCTEIDYITKANSPVLVGRDIFTGSSYILMGITIPYSLNNMVTLFKLDPSERWQMLTKYKCGIVKPSDEPLCTYQQMFDRLKAAGFFHAEELK